MRILATIPARSGSKGLPGKNVKELAGHPLIAHTVMAAVKSPHISRVVVSTDDPVIAAIGRRYGAETPFIRPRPLASDTAPMSRVVRHCLDMMLKRENFTPDYFVLLQPTCPLRTAQQIDEAIRLAKRRRPASVISVCKVQEHPFWMKKIEKGMLKDAFPGQHYGRRQELPAMYSLNGCIYVVQTSAFREKNKIHAHPAIPYVMDHKSSIDIDTAADFLYAEWLMQQRLP